MNPKNQYQLALWYLYHWEGFSLKDVINDSMFVKFQSRLSDIENRHGLLIAKRDHKSFVNRFGTKSNYNVYTAIDKEKIKELFYSY